MTRGNTLKGEIDAVVRHWKADLAAQVKMNADKFMERTSYVEAISKWTPDLMEELWGIADGSGTDFDTMLAFQLVDEYWVNGRAVTREHCSEGRAPSRGKERKCGERLNEVWPDRQCARFNRVSNLRSGVILCR